MRYIFLLVFLFSCSETPDEIKFEISRLRMEREQASVSLLEISRKREAIEVELVRSDSIIKLARSISRGNPTYVLTLRYQAVSMSMDINEHIKNSMNAFQFDIPVDAEYYHQVTIGERLAESFKKGSMIINGGYGTSEITVVDKKIM